MKKISLIIILFASVATMQACNPSAGDSSKNGISSSSGKTDQPSLDVQDSTRIKNGSATGSEK